MARKHPPVERRRLQDLISVGPALVCDFGTAWSAVAWPNWAVAIHRSFMRGSAARRAKPQDICCLDVFRAAVAQARNPQLPLEQCQWWYWSRQRKARDARG